MRYINGSRKFDIDFKTRDSRNYVHVKDVDLPKSTNFWLPEYVVRKMSYVFSWDRYEEDMDIPKVIEALEKEVSRIKNSGLTSPSMQIGMKNLQDNIDKLKIKQG